MMRTDALQWALSAIGLVLLIVVVKRRWHRLQPMRHAASGTVVLVGAIGFIFVYLAGMAAGPIVIEAMGLSEAVREQGLAALDMRAVMLVTAAGLGGQAVAVAIVLPMFTRAQTGRWPTSETHRTWGAVRTTGLAIVALLVIWPIAMLAAHIATYIGSLLRAEPVDPIVHDTLRMLIDSPRHVWFGLMIGVVIVVAPIVEEVLYRGLLQRAAVLWSGSRWAGIVLAAAVFAAGHVSVARAEAIAPLFVLALGFGWAYERTGRLIAPIIMHGLFNAGNVVAAIALSPA